VAWTTWITLMGFVGLIVTTLAVAGPAARATANATSGPALWARLTARLARVAATLGALAVPAVLSELAQQASATGGYDYAAAWAGLFEGGSGWLSGIELTFSLAGALLIAPLGFRSVATGRAREWLLGAGLAAGAVSLAATKLPADLSDGWGRTFVETVVWMMHLFGGAIWIGGLAGLLLLALPGGVAPADRGPFWSAAVRRFSATAMTAVASIILSGLFLYWEHVDGPEQLFTTMYGRVLGVKVLIFGTLLLLGMANQFWLRPRIEALRAAGDQRALRTILVHRFPALVTIELLLGMTVLFVAPFLHGSARNQAFQASAAAHATSATAPLPKLAAKQVSPSTWIWGTAETVVVIAVMMTGYRVSGVLARSRSSALAASAAAAAQAEDPDDLVGS
jgi:putative copper export protein